MELNMELEFFDVVRTRRSVRSFKPRPVSERALKRILRAVRIAPSGSNRQPWRFIVVRDEAVKQKLIPACGDQKWLAEALIIIAACGQVFDYNRGGYMGDSSFLVDVSIGMTHLILAARNEGLGTCWIGMFDNEEVKKVLGVPEGWNVVGLTPLGYPKDGKKAFTKPGKRKRLSEIVSTDKF
jgi:nitroreductase